ncbi:cupin domain-containing protein [Pengzhenrongella sp.]|jgi:quercetin dioxygenase-like cupin family protein|uniref:cupin domain-containing protein n=1 Tax=Pengzhenrongella sp. TaxID=2888820 RepID=UPI002F9315FA
MNRTKKVFAASAMALIVGGFGFAAVAQAAPGQGTVATNSFTGVLDGSASDSTKATQDGVTLKTTAETSVTTFDLTYPPGSYSGWHSHPGIVIAVVRSGSVVRQVGCTSQTFTAGQSFTEVGTHYVSNPGNVDAVLSITRIYPTSMPTKRYEQDAPTCPPRS